MPCVRDCDSADDEAAMRLDRRGIDFALESIDVSSCHATALHGHLTITFLPSGLVGNVDVDDLQPPSEDARACVRDRYGRIRFRSFRGRPVEVGHFF